MNKKILYMSLSFFLLFSMSVMLVNAQTGTVGVNAGDWFKYDISVNWSSENQSEPIPAGFEEMMNAEWTNISIVEISGSTISFGGTTRFKNGTEITVPQVYDMDEGSYDVLGMFFIPPNLDANDLAFSNDVFGDMMINETVSRTYDDGTRETNYASITRENTTNGKTETISMEFYWDKSSGVMVETVWGGTIIDGGYTTTMSMELILDEANLWVVPEFPTWTLLLIGSIALVAVITFYKRKLARKTTTNH